MAMIKLPKVPSFFLKLLQRLAWVLKTNKSSSNVNDDVRNGNGSDDGDYDYCHLCCAGGVEGHVRCLLGLAGGVRNLDGGVGHI